jgi:hypothetical protein
LNTKTSQVERICTTEGQRERETFSYKNKRNENDMKIITTTTRKKKWQNKEQQQQWVD